MLCCAANVFYFPGLLRCLVSALACPLLATRLPDIAVARWRTENKFMWVVATIVMVMRAVRVAEHWATRSTGFQDNVLWWRIFHEAGWSLMDMLLLEVVALLTRVVGAVEHRVLQLQNALSCKADDFWEQAGELCKELINDTGPQLTPLGIPLLFIAVKSLGDGLYMYHELYFAIHTQLADKGSRSLLVAQSCIQVVAVLLAIGVGPLRTSSAISDLNARLAEVRCSAPELHREVQAVECMFDRANDGRGWGIPVCRGVVLNKDFLQKVFFRAAVAMTAVIALLDSQMGFEEADESIEREIDGIRHMLIDIKNRMRQHG